jgi:hypothetical protein
MMKMTNFIPVMKNQTTTDSVWWSQYIPLEWKNRSIRKEYWQEGLFVDRSNEAIGPIPNCVFVSNFTHNDVCYLMRCKLSHWCGCG